MTMINKGIIFSLFFVITFDACTASKKKNNSLSSNENKQGDTSKLRIYYIDGQALQGKAGIPIDTNKLNELTR